MRYSSLTRPISSNRKNGMKYLLSALLLVTLTVATSSPAKGNGGVVLGLGADVLVPTSDWKNVVSTGFWGSIRLQYNIASFFSIGVASGYLTWNGKDSSGSVITPNYSGVPLRAFGKVYVTSVGSPRLYIIAEGGVFFGKTSDHTFYIYEPPIHIPGVGDFPADTVALSVAGKSKTEFNYAPGIGIELPLAGGKTLIDISVRFDAINLSDWKLTRKLTKTSNIGLRLGVNFGL